jgi:hypothetical protein
MADRTILPFMGMRHAGDFVTNLMGMSMDGLDGIKEYPKRRQQPYHCVISDVFSHA